VETGLCKGKAEAKRPAPVAELPKTLKLESLFSERRMKFLKALCDPHNASSGLKLQSLGYCS
jgi:hypothetical protein